MTKFIKSMASAIVLLASMQASAYQLSGHVLLEGGGYRSNQGKNQTININGLIGDRFNVTDHNDTSTIFGVGYLFDGFRNGRFGLDYGVNAFYLAKTKVSGTITQELQFTNLSYNYYVSHLPVYLFVKGFVNTNFNNVAVTLDAGLGPNFMSTNLYADAPYNNTNTLPDNAFEGNFSTTTFSGMIGVGIRFILMQQVPVEVGYRYFNLGEGYFNPRNGQILNKLKTGNNSAQALMVTVSA